MADIIHNFGRDDNGDKWLSERELLNLVYDTYEKEKIDTDATIRMIADILNGKFMEGSCGRKTYSEIFGEEAATCREK